MALSVNIAQPLQVAQGLTPYQLATVQMEGERNRIGNCSKCSLCKSRKNLVFGGGNPNAPIMIIGGSINSAEDKLGAPLAGAGGGLLSQVLIRVGLVAKRDIYATHIVKCISPTDTSVAEYKRLDPTADQIEKCHGTLEKQISIVKPAIVVIHGRQANQVMLGDPRPLSKYMGHFRKYGENCIALSTHNPSGIVRGERQSLQLEYYQHWQEVAEKLNLLGRMWRPDAACFADGWSYTPGV